MSGYEKIVLCRKIVSECQAATIDNVFVDLTSARALVTGYDALLPHNKMKLEMLAERDIAAAIILIFQAFAKAEAN